MFYSHEVLTSRKYGVATVWLVATLGSKSTLRKVSRKAILAVDVAKACETIVEPEAPLALRLQSNLLYGVSRVYLQQCSYVLADAESARIAMRTMLRSIKIADLEAEGANKARPDQLILEDDPNFHPDLDLMLLDLDNFDLNGPAHDSQSSLSPYGSSQLIAGSEQSIGALVLPPSNSSFIPGAVGGLDLLSMQGDSGPGKKLDKPMMLEDDIDLLMSDEDVMQTEPPDRPQAFSTKAVRAVVPGEGEGGHFTQSGPQRDQAMLGPTNDDGSILLQDNDAPVGQDDAVAVAQVADAPVVEQATTSETAIASIARRKRAHKVLPLDTETTHANRVLARWNEGYLEKMKEEMLGKQGYKLAALARKNAHHWVLGNGMSLDHAMCAPLSIFTGAALIEAFTGINLLSGGHKRKRDAVDTDANSSSSIRRVRSRGESSLNEAPRGSQDASFIDGLHDDGYIPMMNDDTIEQGREAPTPLDDQHLSSIFPWNQSAGSRRPTDPHATSTSMGGGGGGGTQLNILGRRGSRLTSASPLLGRGTQGLGSEMDGFQLPDSATNMGGDMIGDMEFELFGPAAQVDTQTAAESQWQRSILGSESANFLDFVKAAVPEHADDEGEDENDKTPPESIGLDDLLPPKQNSRVVAAQAMLHLLALGTKNLLRLEQQEAFGPISISLIEV